MCDTIETCVCADRNAEMCPVVGLSVWSCQHLYKQRVAVGAVVGSGLGNVEIVTEALTELALSRENLETSLNGKVATPEVKSWRKQNPLCNCGVATGFSGLDVR